MSGQLVLAAALTADQARALTDEVKADAAALWAKLLRLYQGAAHTALGYPSWGDYCHAEFDMGASRAYQLLDAGRVVAVLDGHSTVVEPPANEAQARELAPLLRDDERQAVDLWRELRAEHGDRLTAAKVREAVGERMSRDRAARGLLSSGTYEWYTPARYVDAARDVLGAIDLDPASSAQANETVRAARFYDVDQDGLTQEWHGRVWLNPPYGPFTAPFVSKLVAEHDAGRVPEAVLLINGYGFDAAWFRPLWGRPMCFTHHRISFRSPYRDEPGGSTFASVFVYLGPNAARFLRVFARFGAWGTLRLGEVQAS